jgi:hypothetical protein
MSQFNSSNPSAGDSDVTSVVKQRLKDWLIDLFYKKGFRIWIKEEVPFYSISEQKPYHLDMGVLARNKESFDIYSFFGIELDWKTHESFSSDNKDKEKDRAFDKIGVPILRLRVEKLYGKKAWDLPTINDEIWHFFVAPENKEFTEKNQALSIKLKENALARCRNKKCGHPAQKHNLAGCNYQQPNKAALYCPCTEPHFISDA